MKTRICQVCLQEKEITEFKRIRNGTYRHKCKDCWYKLKTKKDTERYQKRAGTSIQETHSENRRKRYDKYSRENIIFKGSRRHDQLNQRENNLTLEFIKEQISLPCSYCSTVVIARTLDRIDNSLGHTMANVLPACLRCNSIRRDMPYEAWIILAKNLKEIVETNLFGEWYGVSKKAAKRIKTL